MQLRGRAVLAGVGGLDHPGHHARYSTVQYSTVQYSAVQYRPPRHPRNSGQGVPLRRLLGRPRPHPQNPVGDDIRCYKRIRLQPSTRHVKRWFAKFDTILLLCIGLCKVYIYKPRGFGARTGGCPKIEARKQTRTETHLISLIIIGSK